MPDQAFRIDRFMATLAQHYPRWSVPSVTLVARGTQSPFAVLASTILSLRTKDEVTFPAARRLLDQADTPAQMLALPEKKIAELIYPVGFYLTKAKRLHQISRILVDRYGGQVPADLDALLELPGVGRKTANLVLIEGFGLPAMCVDTHVHRISNRIGYVATRTPEQTETALRAKLPQRHWKRYNEMLVAFGQALCKPISPWCSRCPVAQMCPRKAVGKSR
jgi:endonuclease-3